MQSWSKPAPVKPFNLERAKAQWNALNQFTPDPNGPDPFLAPAARPGTRALDATPTTELIRTEWFTSLVNTGVRACATFQVDLGVEHYDTPKVCATLADLAGAFAWLTGLLVGDAEAHGTQVKGLSKSSIDNLIVTLGVARSSSSVAS